jgi:2Fe-2S ferredoxin
MKVKFLPQNVEFEIKPGQTIMSVAHDNGIVIRSACNGMPSCAECRVRVVDGDWNINPPSRKELGLIGTGYYIDQRRLSCQVLCFGDVTVDTTEQIEKSAEGPVTKKFLTKVHKSSAQESHSLGGMMIEQDAKLLQEMKKDVSENIQPVAVAGLVAREDRPRGGGGGGQNRGGGGQQQQQQGQGQGRGGGRSRRGGRGRRGGGGGNNSGGGGGGNNGGGGGGNNGGGGRR